MTFVLSFLMLYAFFAIFMLSGIANSLIYNYSLSIDQLELIRMSAVTGVAIAILPAGVISDHCSIKPTLLIFLLISLFLLQLLHWVTALYFIIGISFVIGVCSAFFIILSFKLIVRWVGLKHFAFTISLLMFFAVFGCLLSHTPLYLFTQSFGKAIFFTAISGVMLLIFLLILLFIKEKPEGYDEFVAKYFPDISVGKRLSMAVKKPANWLLGIYAGVINLPLFVFGGLWGKLYFFNTMQFSMIHSFNLMTTLFVGAMVGFLFFGWLSSRFIRRRPLMIAAPLFGALLVGVLLLTADLSYDTSLVIFFFFGLTVGAQILSYLMMMELNESFIAGEAISVIFFSLFGLAILTMPLFELLLGWHAKTELLMQTHVVQVQHFHFAMTVFLLAFGLAFLVSFFLPETCSKRQRV